MKANRKNKRFFLFAATLMSCAFLFIMLPLSVLGASVNWTGPDGGLWSEAANWSGGVPLAADDATINNGKTAVIDDSYTPPSGALSSLVIDSGSMLELSPGAQNLSVGKGEDGGGISIGSTSSGYLIQSDGSVYLNGSNGNGTLRLGGSAGSSGRYYMDGGTLTLADGEEYIGYSAGTGNFEQWGGVHDFSGAVYIGVGDVYSTNRTAYGQYDLYDGTLQSTNSGIAIGEWGSEGYFNQYGGIVNIENLTLGRQGGSYGEYHLEDGSLTVTGSEIVGRDGEGVFVQNGGIHMAGSLTVGAYEENLGPSVRTGTYTMGEEMMLSAAATSETADLTVINDLILGEGGSGTFNQNYGIVEVGGNLMIGRVDTENGTGTYNLGHSDLYVSGTEYVGDGSYGEFNNMGGINTVGGDLYIGNSPASEGRYVLSEMGILEVSGNLYVGYNGGLGSFYRPDDSSFSITANEIHIGVNGLFASPGTVFTNEFENNGTLMPGSSPGIMQIEGNYTQGDTGVLSIELGGTDWYDFDSLSVSGSATLSGELELSLYEGFIPEAGDYFDIIVADSIFGDFTSIIGPAGYSWDVTFEKVYDETSGEFGTVRVTANAVPIPAAAWLFGSVLVGVTGIRRKYSANSGR